MGLDTTHDCWHGSYSMFHRWRCWLAMEAGYPPLDLMDGFIDESRLAIIRIGFDRSNDRDGKWPFWLSPEHLPIPWDNFKPDPLIELLTHSDCEGEIPAESCGPIADRLEALLGEIECDPEADRFAELPEKEKPKRGIYDGMFPATKRFIAGLRAAAAADEPVEFH